MRVTTAPQRSTRKAASKHPPPEMTLINWDAPVSAAAHSALARWLLMLVDQDEQAAAEESQATAAQAEHTGGEVLA